MYGKVKVTLKSKNERNSYNGYKNEVYCESVVSEDIILYLCL